MATSASFSRYDVRNIIKFSLLSGKAAPQIHQELTEVLGDDAPSIQTVRKWIREIQDGRESLEDKERSGRPRSATTDVNVSRVKDAVSEDNRRTCGELEELLGIPHSTVHRILTESLGMQKLFAKWVPHLLTEDQMKERLTMSCGHLRRAQQEGERFLSRIVTGDETWVYEWDPELKRQSAQWLPKGSPNPEKVRRKQGSLKVMHIVFFDIHGVLLDWPVPVGTRVNAEYYRWVLQEKLRPAIRKKRPGLLEEGVIFHHDNAPVHRARRVEELLESWGWELLSQPRYSPDLAPADFYLFPRMKESLRGQRFASEEQVNNSASSALRQLAINGCQAAFDAWVRRWQKCVDLGGRYVE